MPTSSIVGISGSGAYFPKQEVQVKHLAQKYHLNYSNILREQGIRKVHVASSDETELFMATKAAEQALRDSSLSSSDIKLVIFCKGITRQKTARPVSLQIIENLKAADAYGFDIEGGLIGGLIGIQVANDMIKNNYSINNALIVAAQEFDELYLFGGGAARVRNMIFGDGAAAIVLSRDASNNNILASEFVIDHYTSFIDALLAESLRKESRLEQVFQKLKGVGVVKRIQQKQKLSKLTERWVENSYQVIKSSVQSINLDVSDINHFVKTQLSVKETELLCQKLNIIPDKIFNTSSENGHLGQADIIYNLHSVLKNPNLKNLDLIALVTANYDCSSGAIILRR